MNNSINMTVPKSLVELGIDPEDTTERSAIEIAKLSGYVSDRWTRDERAEIEAIFRKCRNGGDLIEALKAPDGRRYSGFAYQMIRLKQNLTSTNIPVVRNGSVATDRTGRAKTRKVERQMLLSDFSALIVQKLGSAEDSDYSDPDADPDWEPELFLESDPEKVSTAIVWSPVEAISAAPILDASAEIAGDTKSSIAGFKSRILQSFGAMGEQLGAEAVQEFQLNFQRQINQGLADAASVTDAQPGEEKPTKARRTTKKK